MTAKWLSPLSWGSDYRGERDICSRDETFELLGHGIHEVSVLCDI